MNRKKSGELFERAKEIIPGGVNSPVRAYKSVGLNPPFVKKAKGSKIYDADGNEYIDYVCSWGPMILGHANDEVVEEIKNAAIDGTSYGAPTEREVELAEIVCEAVPSVDMVRMVSSGTEAVMSAIRLSRGFTGRDMIIKFEGCYHGHSDGLLIKAGSGALTTGVPDSAGVPLSLTKNTMNASYNDFDEIEGIFKAYGEKIAAVIVEPVAGNMGLVPPKENFLKFIREITLRYGALFIFDEVITGFRVSYSGAQGFYGIQPDISVFGKIIGGGMPVGAYGGRREIMNMISPNGPVYQAGTLSGNPVAMAAGIKTLQILRDNPSIYEEFDKKSQVLKEAYLKASEKYGIPLSVNRLGSLLCPFFTDKKVYDYNTAVASDTKRFSEYFKVMLDNGIYAAPSQFECMFLSSAHTNEDLLKTAEVIDVAFSKLK